MTLVDDDVMGKGFDQFLVLEAPSSSIHQQEL